ncbi:MAG: DUF1990 domain-containing protein [Nakamurella sp.]
MTQLDDATAARLRAAPLTHPGVGATVAAVGALDAPTGYRTFRRSRSLRRTDLEGAAAELLGWAMQTGSGLRVAASDPTVVSGTVAERRLGPGRFSLRIPCRVVAVIDEPERRGFAYGTLPGHPVSGEEAFFVERLTDGSLQATVVAFSRPATLLSRLGGPGTRLVQRLMSARYLRALDRPTRGPR